MNREDNKGSQDPTPEGPPDTLKGVKDRIAALRGVASASTPEANATPVEDAGPDPLAYDPVNGIRPSMKDPVVRQALLSSIEALNSEEEAIADIGVPRSTYYEWKRRAIQQERVGVKGTPELDFLDGLRASRRRRSARLNTIIANGCLEDPWLALEVQSRREPKVWNPQVRDVLNTEFSNAIASLQAEFADDPVLLARALRALLGGPRRAGPGTPGALPGVGSEGGERGEGEAPPADGADSEDAPGVAASDAPVGAGGEAGEL